MQKISAWKESVLLGGFLFVLTYPFLYYCYKFSIPDLGMVDFYNYYPIYSKLDFNSVIAPFNTRIISSTLIYYLSQTGFYYPAEISFQNANIDQKVYFAAIFMNYLAILMSVGFVRRTLREVSSNIFQNLVFSLLIFFSFGTLFWSISACNDAFGVLLVAACFYYYSQRSYGIIIPLILSLFQREFIFFAFSGLAFFDLLLNRKNKYFTAVFLLNIVLFGTYLTLRKTIWYDPVHSNQIEASGWFSSLSVLDLNAAYFKQVLMSQNVLFIYLLFIGVKNFLLKQKIQKVNLLRVLFIVAFTTCVIIIARLGTSGGRFIYMLSPIVIYYFYQEFVTIKTASYK